MNKEMNYNEAMKRLKTIVSEIEKENPDVDQLAAMTEEAMELINFCRNTLTTANDKIQTLLKQIDPKE